MQLRVHSQIWLITLCTGLLVGLPTAQAQNEPSPVQASLFAPAEIEVAQQVAERELARLGLRTATPMFLVEMELLQPKDEGGERSARRVARVVHYRYDNLAIIIFVDLASRQVEKVEQIANLPVPLAPEELAVAKELSLADPEVRRLLGNQASRATVEALVAHITQRTDRLFGHRVVELLFRVDQGYLARQVLVDLTDRKVIVGKAPAAEHRQTGH